MKYESPITKVYRQIQNEIIKKDEETLMCSVKQSVGYLVDKDELIKALAYDRGQYQKGYKDALSNIRDEIENDWQLIMYPASPFSCGLRRAMEIIDKYMKEF